MANEIEHDILHGSVFHGAPKPGTESGKIKTKAKKKTYITGAHGSASAKMKADIRKRRANRPSQKKNQQ